MCRAYIDEEAAALACAAQNEPRSEQVLVDMIREDLGVTIDPQAWRMFIRHRWSRIAPLAHRIHDGKR
jgi:hypothetical protein